ncbi:hypothetical protein ASPGLDRAFT_1501371 [Aspergillus glaucus CBS 516.65]|uniref:Uncharacterized protein n=1 Tax=Aspergillus glaucus CBS 516.65 TaxID=1160497 RepID=A0A1L9V9S6_ASPGL|nr:hypothetical protein ASPGLDRAFT_1501371 [Aspergillus glaucus CBS 516.65]OJJ80659.1 hypothetical protein ASPGLDRAFT_1501371 [Aspergillus glaucus CBS 516.65]
MKAYHLHGFININLNISRPLRFQVSKKHRADQLAVFLIVCNDPESGICSGVPSSAWLVERATRCTNPGSPHIICFSYKASTYDHRVWRTGLPVRSAVLKPHAGRLVVGWVTTSESRLLYVFISFHFFFALNQPATLSCWV